MKINSGLETSQFVLVNLLNALLIFYFKSISLYIRKKLTQYVWCIKLRGKIGTKFLFNIKKESIRKSTGDWFKENMQEIHTFS